MKRGISFLLCLFALTACKSKSTEQGVIVNVLNPSAVAGIVRLSVSASNGGPPDTLFFPTTAQTAPIAFPTAFSVTMPASRSGEVDLAIDGLDSFGAVVANATTFAVLQAGNFVPTTVKLQPGAASGTDGGAEAGGTVGVDGGTGSGSGGASTTGGTTGGGGQSGFGGLGTTGDASDRDGSPSTGGASGNDGGPSTGSGGTSTGDSAAGGTTGIGGASGGSSGTNNGGSAKGGSSGTNNGGSAKGGSSGTNSGGSAKGGSSGTNSGGSSGTNNGGSSAGGTTGGGTGGSNAGGSTSTGTNPPGWYTTSDWGITSVDWHGCVWTGVDSTVSGSTTSISPKDFTAATTEGGPYEVTGSVFNDYNSVALLGFDLNDTPKGGATQCGNVKRDPTADGPPAVTMPSSATGFAINWSAAKLPADFRIQIQGVKGASDATNRWCASVSGANGPSFVPFSSFSTTCWNTTGTQYNNEPISAVAFLVPGTTSAAKPFDITVVGFAPGTSEADAPGKQQECGTKTGTVGTTSLLSDATKATDASAERTAVSGTDCKTYIINNNNWGQESSTYQALDYVGNSFTVNVTSGSGGGANMVSFPSIYIGANGNIGVGDAYNTWKDSGLPKKISEMNSAKSTFQWSGGNSGNYNAAYDIWFSKKSPTAGDYNDGISGFIMIWTFKPSSSEPIGGGNTKRDATIDGKSYTVWRGNRNATATGTDGAGRPVISYVANTTNNNFSSDLKLFFDDAVTNGAADMAAGSGITQAFDSSWYLTDVFAGFEIWNGSDAKGLKDTFTCVIE
jgi:hypothetical protein